ncbi:MAG: hypothetical protein QOD32_1906 [Pyrinomonadaceae bacterium]|jgi:hypothetical protein|nr:hypothetical protein [Pyrinomonadaceae bacterium]
MNRTAIRLAITLATFLIGVSVVYLIWFAGKRSAPASVAVPSSTPEPVNSPTASSDANLEEKSVEDEWAGLLEAGGCLFGSVYYNPQSEALANKSVPAEAPGVFTNQRWQAFFGRNKQETVPFLIKQIPDKSKTNLHVDPFQPPTRGEAAVYALQHILKFNWYELKEDYRDRYDKAGYPFTHQALLQQIIKTKGGAKEMQDLWMKYYESHTPLN